MGRIALITAIVLAASQAWTADLSAAGLSIEPGGLLLQDIPIGEARSVVESSGISFVVHNRDGISHEYRISAHRPSEAGNGKCAKGYCEIPDASWIKPAPDVLTIPPGSSASFDVVIDLPDDGRLYNQKWIAVLAVESVPTPGANVALALYPALQIETMASDLAQARPLGSVAVAPATLRADAGSDTLAFEVYNNDILAHGYVIHVAPPGGKIPVSPGLRAAEGDDFVVPRSPRLWVEAGGRGLVLLDMGPAAEKRLDSWEQLVFVESEAGECTFVRLQMVSD